MNRKKSMSTGEAEVQQHIQGLTLVASNETGTPVPVTSDSLTEVTVLLARLFASIGLCVSVGGGVGGAPPTTGARPCSIFVSDRFKGSGEDLWELGGVEEEAALLCKGLLEGELGSKMSFSIAAICLP